MFEVSASPHIKSAVYTHEIMADVCIALIPAFVFGVYIYGAYAACIVGVSIASCIFFEYIYLRIMGCADGTGINDMSAAVTGLLLGLNMPPHTPLFIPVIGAAFAIIVVKMVFGGIGNNFVNPALAARAFLLASFPVAMTLWTRTGVN